MVSEERINKVIDSYVDRLRDVLEKIDERDNGKNSIGSTEWKLRNHYQDKLILLENIREELLY